jgi:alpha-L-fucosidase
LYLHLMKYPADGKLTLAGAAEKVKYAQLLHDASEVRSAANGADLTLTFPKDKPPVEVPVVEMFLK